MRQKPGGRALRFTAVQDYAVDRFSFSWRARFPIVGPFRLRVVDSYAEGAGELSVRVLGVPLQRQSDRETAKGEALRYLAELPWVPFAMTANPELEWREVDERRVEAASEVLGERLAVTLELDAAGDIVRASSEQRRLRLGKDWLARPWAGEYSGYERLGGVRLPTRAEVYWELEESRFVYWRGRVTSVELLDEPFRLR